MIQYNEATQEFEEVEIKFFIGGKETSDERLLIHIPRKYTSRFEGHNFPTMHVLSMALMHASGAEEAREYGKAHIVRQCEQALNEYLKMDA